MLLLMPTPEDEVRCGCGDGAEAPKHGYRVYADSVDESWSYHFIHVFIVIMLIRYRCQSVDYAASSELR